MKKDGLVPIAFADKDGWPAMGTFDYLNMRLNGYDFHINLMAARSRGTDPKVKDGLRHLEASCCPTTRPARSAAPGRRPRRRSAQKKAGMYLLGTFVAQQFTGRRPATTWTSSRSRRSTRRSAPDAVEAPIDGFMMAKRPKNEAGAKELLEYLGIGRGREHLPQDRPERRRGANNKADTRGYNALQKKACRAHRQRQEHLAVPRPRRRPDFASTVMIPALQKFIKNPKRHRRARQEHRGAEEVDLPELAGTVAVSTTGGPDRRRPAHRRPARARAGGPRTDATRRDKLVLALMIGIPTLIRRGAGLVPARSRPSRCRSPAGTASAWTASSGSALRNYRQIFTIYPPFWPALRHNLIWLVFFLLIPTPIGLFLAVPAGPGVRFTRVYQSVFFLPVVLSLAVVGFIWQLMYSRDQGLINAVLGKRRPRRSTGWATRSINIWAVLVAASWRHVGYMMILYLAGLKSVDPALKEAAAIDGANELADVLPDVVFPALRPINIVVLVITVIESLRAFDLVYVINGGRNGLELLSVLVTQNIIGEASRIGYGSAIADDHAGDLDACSSSSTRVNIFREERR